MPLSLARALLPPSAEAAYIDQSQAGTMLFAAASLQDKAGFG